MSDLDRYLRRLGIGDPGPPTAEALVAIHRAQVEHVAYNTVDIHLGRPKPLDPAETLARTVATGRAGYCFHLNGVLADVLGRLGYDVRHHRGGVWDDPGEEPLRPFANHLALTVHGLPTDDNPGGRWFVDAGLGDALHEPMPLRPGAVWQGPYDFRLEPSPALPGGWRFTHDPAGSFPGMDFEPGLAGLDDFAASHRWLSTNPQSPFVQRLSVQRRDATGGDKLVSRTLRRTEAGQKTGRVLSRDEWFAALADVFRVTLDDTSPDERDALWKRVRAAQDEWERSQA